MSIQDQWRSARRPTPDTANAWSVLEYQAHDRMAELLREAEQKRLARLARVPRRPRSRGARSAPSRAWLTAGLAALGAVARHIGILRPEPEG